MSPRYFLAADEIIFILQIGKTENTLHRTMREMERGGAENCGENEGKSWTDEAKKGMRFWPKGVPKHLPVNNCPYFCRHYSPTGFQS